MMGGTVADKIRSQRTLWIHNRTDRIDLILSRCQGSSCVSSALISPPSQIATEPVAVHLIREGQWREAIYLYREETGVNLAIAEQAIERLALKHGIHRYSRGFCVTLIAILGLSLIMLAGLVEWLS